MRIEEWADAARTGASVSADGTVGREAFAVAAQNVVVTLRRTARGEPGVMLLLLCAAEW